MDGCREIPVTEQVSKRKIQIMGIVNLTDDSYFAPSRCLGTDGRSDMKKVLGRVSRMLEEGADIIDIGACSTRPGSEPVGEEEEWRRLEPVLKAIKDSFPDAVISIDLLSAGSDLNISQCTRGASRRPCRVSAIMEM